MRAVRWWSGFVGVGVILISLAGCSDASGSGGESRALSPEEMEAEYWQTTEDLTLPPEAEWPPVTHLPPEDDGRGNQVGHTYEPGYGVTTAYQAWFCAWQREWLAQRGEDPEREAEALEKMQSYLDLPRIEEFYEPEGLSFLGDMLAQAELGDPTGVSSNVENNCGSSE